MNVWQNPPLRVQYQWNWKDSIKRLDNIRVTNSVAHSDIQCKLRIYNPKHIHKNSVDVRSLWQNNPRTKNKIFKNFPHEMWELKKNVSSLGLRDHQKKGLKRIGCWAWVCNVLVKICVGWYDRLNAWL